MEITEAQYERIRAVQCEPDELAAAVRAGPLLGNKRGSLRRDELMQQ